MPRSEVHMAIRNILPFLLFTLSLAPSEESVLLVSGGYGSLGNLADVELHNLSDGEDITCRKPADLPR